ncbi:hypothetical protein KPH14_008636 [Odynerus spinipes]|uniref:Secreted protein n=1 Tax=Odynerus spinipes TaxID=1348599 RepID=A0AAD9RTI0_9HYME|nr:hypothetical protein KPH14_008636 [Odynerus spinipes]
MGLSFVTNLFVLVLVMLCVSSSPVPYENVTCDCKYCEEKATTIDPVGEKEMTTIVPDEKASKKGSNSGDGDETICARDRDLPDKTFPSVCHMLCHNQCTRYRGALLEKENTTRRVPLAYRTNYYLLWDGPCERDGHDTD